MARQKRSVKRLALNQPGYLPLRMEAQIEGGARRHRWPWDLAVISVPSVLAATGTPAAKGFDPELLLSDITDRIDKWRQDNKSSVLNPLAEITFPDNHAGRSQVHLVNSILAMSDEAVAEACWHLAHRDQPG